jgi:hypothetical protein
MLFVGMLVSTVLEHSAPGAAPVAEAAASVVPCIYLPPTGSPAGGGASTQKNPRVCTPTPTNTPTIPTNTPTSTPTNTPTPTPT